MTRRSSVAVLVPRRTLAAVPKSFKYATLQMPTSQAVARKGAGCDAGMVEVKMGFWMPTVGAGYGARNTGTYCANIAANIKALVENGIEVTLGVGLHFPAPWVFTSHAGLVSFTNMQGVTTGPVTVNGNTGSIDLVWSAAGEALWKAYLADLKAYLSGVTATYNGVSRTLWDWIAYIRIAAGTKNGELTHDETGGYSWQGFSSWAQNGGSNLASYARSASQPVSVGGAGLGSGLQPSTQAQVTAFAIWNYQALVRLGNAQQDYLTTTLGFNGRLQWMMPGYGVKVADWNTNNTARTTLNPTSFIASGAVWHLVAAEIALKSRSGVHCSSTADQSGAPVDNAATIADRTVLPTAATTAVGNWSAARRSQHLAWYYGLEWSGENPGSGTPASAHYLDKTSNGMIAKGLDLCANGRQVYGGNTVTRYYHAHDDDFTNGNLDILDLAFYFGQLTDTIATYNLVGHNRVFSDDMAYTVAEGGVDVLSSGELNPTAAGYAQLHNDFAFYMDGWNTTHGGKVYPKTPGEPGYPGDWPPIVSKYYPTKCASFATTVPDGSAKGVFRVRMHSELVGGVMTAMSSVLKPKLSTGKYMLGPYGIWDFRSRVTVASTGGVDYAALKNFITAATIGFIQVPLGIDSNNWPINGEEDFPDGQVQVRIEGTYIPAAPTQESWPITTAFPVSPYDWNRFRVIWEPGRLRFILNGVVLKDTTDRVPAGAQAIVLQYESDWRQPPADAVATVEVDHCTIWERAA